MTYRIDITATRNGDQRTITAAEHPTASAAMLWAEGGGLEAWLDFYGSARLAWTAKIIGPDGVVCSSYNADDLERIAEAQR